MSTAAAGVSAIAFQVARAAAVEATHAAWAARGLPIARASTAMRFGTTFVGVDRDRYWLRVFAPPAA